MITKKLKLKFKLGLSSLESISLISKETKPNSASISSLETKANIASIIDTSTVSIPPEEVAKEIERFRGLALAFENFTKTDNLDSFKGLEFDNEIERARELLSKDSSNIAEIKKEFLEYGNCLIKEFKNQNVSDDEKVDKLSECYENEGKDLLTFIAKADSPSNS